jgi:hypothetical protein
MDNDFQHIIDEITNDELMQHIKRINESLEVNYPEEIDLDLMLRGLN